MSKVTVFVYRKMPVRVVNVDDDNFFVVRDICNILGFSNPNRELAKHTENVPKYERIRTPGGLQIVRLVPRSDVMKLLAANRGNKAAQLERWLNREVFPVLDADEKALEEARSLILGFVGMMHTTMAQQYFADQNCRRHGKYPRTMMMLGMGRNR